VRRQPDPAFDRAVEVRKADARSKEQVRSVIGGFDAVVNVIGGGTLGRNDVASSASAVIVPTVEAVGIKRYIAMSAGMVALDWFKYVLRPLIFRHILAEHRRVEEIVRAWVQTEINAHLGPGGHIERRELGFSNGLDIY
jgi:hypothetical protein